MRSFQKGVDVHWKLGAWLVCHMLQSGATAKQQKQGAFALPLALPNFWALIFCTKAGALACCTTALHHICLVILCTCHVSTSPLASQQTSSGGNYESAIMGVLSLA